LRASAGLNRHVQALLLVQIRPLSRAVVASFKKYVSARREVLSGFVAAGGSPARGSSVGRARCRVLRRVPAYLEHGGHGLSRLCDTHRPGDLAGSGDVR
jgi:hypothetical protein